MRAPQTFIRRISIRGVQIKPNGNNSSDIICLVMFPYARISAASYFNFGSAYIFMEAFANQFHLNTNIRKDSFAAGTPPRVDQL